MTNGNQMPPPHTHWWVDIVDPHAGGTGVPPGGTAGQVLTKNSGTDYDDSWQTPAAGVSPATSVVSETAAGQAAAVGVSPNYARQDHTHGTPPAPTVPGPGSSVVAETTYGQASAVGAATTYARSDHTHGSPAFPAGTAAVVFPETQTAHGFVVGDVVRMLSTMGTLLTADNFNRANQTNLGNTNGAGSLDPLAWPADGCWSISGNQAVMIQSSGSPSYTFLDVGTGNVDVSLRLVTQGTAGGLFIRYTDTNNMIWIQSSFGTVTVYRRQAGASTSILSCGTFANGDTIRVVATGSSITVYRNGTQVGTVTETFNQTATKVGLSGGFNNNTVDDFSVTSAPSSALAFAKAQANNIVNAEALGVVSQVIDANNFNITQAGKISGLSGLIVGAPYFLSPTTPGAISTAAPSTSGQVSRPILIPDSATTAIVLPYRGSVIP